MDSHLRTMAARGAVLFRQLGCEGCHGENSPVGAPKLAGLYGKRVRLADGSTTIVDEIYLRNAVLSPSTVRHLPLPRKSEGGNSESTSSRRLSSIPADGNPKNIAPSPGGGGWPVLTTDADAFKNIAPSPGGGGWGRGGVGGVAMPSFRGRIVDEDLNDIVEYIKSLKDGQ